ncbi:hypothetical protein SLS64_009329 [Diaporthe eres]
MSTPAPVEVSASNLHRKDAIEAEKLGVDVEEVVVTRISEEDLIRISRECLDIHSPTGWRIALITLVMGFNMAGYGVDWGVIGSINSYDTFHGNNNYQWRIPLILEAFFPLLVCATIYFLCPESPRYLILKGRREEARKVIAKYMTTHDDVDAPIVPLIMQQMEESIESSRTGKWAAYDYRVFFTKAVGYRTGVLILYSIFQQWNGGAIISYYLSPALDTIGITAAVDQLGINLGSTMVYFVFEFVGAFLLAATITSWQYSLHESHATAVLTVVWIFIYQVCSASLIATMHNLYPVEILSLPLRAKGMGFYNMVQGAAGVVQNYGISVGIQKVGYKIWVVYIVYNTLQLVAAYFVFPETSKLNLEEIDTIFETPGSNPVKLSLKIEKAREEKERLAREGAA